MSYRLENNDPIGLPMKSILFLSSWRIIDTQKGTVEVPFIFEQIASLSSVVNATYVECNFKSFINWIPLFVSGRWILKNENSLWQNYSVRYFTIFLPKFSSRLTKNALWQDFYISGRWFAKRLARKLGKFDVIHTHVVLPMGGFAVALSAKWKIPFILQEHSGPFEMHCSNAKQVKGVQFVLSRCSLKLPVSNALKRRMQVYDSMNNYRIAPNLIRTDIFKPCIKSSAVNSNAIKIISVCSAQKVKRHDLMFLTVKELISRNIPVKLTLYGIDRTEIELVELCNSLGLNDMVSFMGNTDKSTIYDAFCDHDVYLCTSDIETFGLAPAEAICSGLPVVSSDCGGVSEFLNPENSVIVRDNDPKVFGDAIESIMRKPIHRVSSWNKINNQYGIEPYKNYWFKLYSKIQ